MDTWRWTEQGSPNELQTVVHLACPAEASDVRSFGDGVRVTFPEAEFVIRMSSLRSDAPCETDWEVTVREPLPGLSTWWGRWQRTFAARPSDVGPLIAAELREALARVQAMLDDHARSAGTGAVSPSA